MIFKRLLLKQIKQFFLEGDSPTLIKNIIDIKNYKKQQNYVVNLNKNAKFEYFSRHKLKKGKRFLVNSKLYFSNKHKVDNNIALNEDGELILKNKKAANTFNDYLALLLKTLI